MQYCTLCSEPSCWELMLKGFEFERWPWATGVQKHRMWNELVTLESVASVARTSRMSLRPPRSHHVEKPKWEKWNLRAGHESKGTCVGRTARRTQLSPPYSPRECKDEKVFFKSGFHTTVTNLVVLFVTASSTQSWVASSDEEFLVHFSAAWFSTGWPSLGHHPPVFCNSCKCRSEDESNQTAGNYCLYLLGNLYQFVVGFCLHRWRDVHTQRIKQILVIWIVHRSMVLPTPRSLETR